MFCFPQLLLRKCIINKIEDSIIRCYVLRACPAYYSTEVKNSKEKVHFFGFQEVTSFQKREKVQSVFTNVADKYDLMNDCMSAGVHRLWKDYFVHNLAPTPGMKLLDVAGGTGDIAFRFLKTCLDSQITSLNDQVEESKYLQSHVTVFDMNDKMLSVCKTKAEGNGFSKYITCIQGNAESLPFPNNIFDAYTIAFGVRNVVHIDEALSEAFRVLKPGGRFLCLEFSQVQNTAFERIYNWYSKEIIPVMGEIIAGDWKSYQYLIESIAKFPNQEEFTSMIKDSGFSTVSYENLFSGVAAIHSAYKL